MFDMALKSSQFQLDYCESLIANIDDERFAFQPLPGVHHPAWIVGHLAVVIDFVPALLGQEKALPDSWRALFGPGTKEQADRSLYPSKAELWEALVRGHQRAAEVVAAAPTEVLGQPNPTGVERLAGFKTVGELVFALLTSHEAIHLGQLSFWRRCVGLPVIF